MKIHLLLSLLILLGSQSVVAQSLDDCKSISSQRERVLLFSRNPQNGEIIIKGKNNGRITTFGSLSQREISSLYSNSFIRAPGAYLGLLGTVANTATFGFMELDKHGLTARSQWRRASLQFCIHKASQQPSYEVSLGQWEFESVIKDIKDIIKDSSSPSFAQRTVRTVRRAGNAVVDTLRDSNPKADLPSSSGARKSNVGASRR